jgi:hypothetical protein
MEIRNRAGEELARGFEIKLRDEHAGLMMKP